MKYQPSGKKKPRTAPQKTSRLLMCPEQITRPKSLQFILLLLLSLSINFFNKSEVSQGRIRDTQVAQESFIIAPCYV
jgi:hypothetical protein